MLEGRRREGMFNETPSKHLPTKCWFTVHGMAKDPFPPKVLPWRNLASTQEFKEHPTRIGAAGYTEQCLGHSC